MRDDSTERGRQAHVRTDAHGPRVSSDRTQALNGTSDRLRDEMRQLGVTATDVRKELGE